MQRTLDAGHSAEGSQNQIAAIQRAQYIAPDPRFPTPQSMAGRCLARLLTGEKLTHHDFLEGTASYRLSRDVHVLGERHGWEVEREDYRRAVMDRNTIVLRTFRRYWLAKRTIQRAGERGRKFMAAVADYERREVR